MPDVSIILPTYNRADTIPRAIESVRDQTFADWELIIVDDGSTDGTAERINKLDPRIRILRQENQGCYVARNSGIAAAKGRFIAFLDSDDEWLPHFLEIAMAFFEWSPSDYFLTTEFLERVGPETFIRHDHYNVSTEFPRVARAVGSRMLDLPSGETDDYLRVYSTRERLGAWGRAIAERAGHPNAALYRGRIFEKMRWGYLNWLPITVLRREAIDTVGLFPSHYRTAADFRFLAQLCRHFQANMITLPSAIKHRDAPGDKALAQDHLATGPNEYRYARAKLALFDDMFWNERRGDKELSAIRAFRLLYAGRTALKWGELEAARMHLRDTCAAAPHLWRARLLRLWVEMVPASRVASAAYRWALRLGNMRGFLRARKASAGACLGRVVERIRKRAPEVAKNRQH